jgi:penicillin-binding protein 1B
VFANSLKSSLLENVHRHPVLAGLGGLVIVFSIYLVYLDWQITSKFEGRRWNLPAQVYARPLELFVGLTLTRARLEQELSRLGYARAEQRLKPGTFRAHRDRVELVTREFAFWDGFQESVPLVVEFQSGRISRLTGDRDDVPIVRVDPLLIGSIFPGSGEDRLILSPDEVPEVLTAALKVVEDRRFDQHPGIDLLAIGRAFIANLRAGEVTQGGSTLTQQLVKSYFLDNRRTLSRKAREAVMALMLEARFEKDDLLNAYVNEIYLGQDGRRAIHGFGLASQYYFSQPLAELDPHEIALLVAMARGPSYYDPRRHPQRARERRNLVLQLMADFQIIDEAVSRHASARELEVTDRRSDRASYYPAFMQLVRRQLHEQYREEDLTNEGLRVFTTLDPLIQVSAEQQLVGGLESLQHRAAPSEHELEGAVVVTSTQNSEILAIVGGGRVGYDGFNHALDGRRPIGSLVKPVVYLAALQTGEYNLASLVDDAQIDVPLENGDIWQPKNFSGEAHGSVTLIRALAESFNMATVRLGMEVGVNDVAELLHSLGAPDKPMAYPSLLLGATEMTPLDIAQIYTSLANGGFRSPLRAVRSVVDSAGQPLQRYPLQLQQAADAAAVYQLNQGLVEVMRRGTGKTARDYFPDAMVIAGKTGTSDGFRDSWFAGFNGDQLAVVWVGYDDNRPTALTGAAGALSIWAPMMADVGGSSYAPVVPANLEPVWIDYESGLLAGPRCGDPTLLAMPADFDSQVEPDCGFDLTLMGKRTLKWLDSVLN